MIKISDRGLKFIANFEGKRNSVYLDAAGYPTIGIGHLIQKGESFPEKLTDEQVYSLFRKDLERYENAVNKSVKVEINQNQYDALVSFAFNLGIGALQQSTLLKKLNARKYQEAADQFLLWNKAGGKVLLGLTRRREAERAMFMEPVKNKLDYKGHWAEKSIEWVIKNGIMNGYKDGSFKPDQPVTRAELAAILNVFYSKT